MNHIDTYEGSLAADASDEMQVPALIQSQPATLTPAQARVDSVARAMDTAMNKASTLMLTPEEVAALKADFPDDAFKPGAAGKESLIYIEHAFLRDRMDSVIGMGQWAILRTRPHWAEEFTTQKGEKATRIYADCALLVRGCMVAESIGEMVYYPNNAAQNYGDAAEGAVTAAFRRCAKNFGVGLQAWKKDWCLGWWERQRGVRRNTPPPSPSPAGRTGTPKPSEDPSEAEEAVKSPPTPKFTAKDQAAAFDALLASCKSRFISQVKPYMPAALEYFRGLAHNGLMANEFLEDMPPASMFPSADATKSAEHNHLVIKADRDKHMKAIAAIVDANGQLPGAEIPAEEPEPAIHVPRDDDSDMTGEAWRDVPVPFGKNKGMRLEELAKPTLFGFWANFSVSTHYEKDGAMKERTPAAIETDTAFRAALDAAGEHYEFTKKD